MERLFLPMESEGVLWAGVGEDGRWMGDIASEGDKMRAKGRYAVPLCSPKRTAR